MIQSLRAFLQYCHILETEIYSFKNIAIKFVNGLLELGQLNENKC